MESLSEYLSPPGDLPRAGVEAKTEAAPQAAENKSIAEAFDKETKGDSALCLSGGGIRSATFSLGVVQALAAIGWLKEFTYLSTVSGGGYTGGWLSAWIYREEQARKQSGTPGDIHLAAVTLVEEKLRGGVSRDCGDPEPEQIRRLRSYCNYLSPKAGVSGDLLAVISIYFRNLFLNWLVLLPLLFTLVLIPIWVVGTSTALQRHLLIDPPAQSIRAPSNQESSAQPLVPRISTDEGVGSQVWSRLKAGAKAGLAAAETTKTVVASVRQRLSGWAIGCIIVAILCGIAAVAYSTSDLPAEGRHQTRRSYFGWLWIAPMLLGCLALAQPVIATILAPILPEIPNQTWWAVAATGGAVLHVLGVLIGTPLRALRDLKLPDDAAATELASRSWRDALNPASRFLHDLNALGRSGLREEYRKIPWSSLGKAAVSGIVAGLVLCALIWSAHKALVETAMVQKGYALIFLEITLLPALLLVFQLGTSLYLALLADRADEGAREWWGRAGGAALQASGIWIAATAIGVALPFLIGDAVHRVHLDVSGTIGGVVAVLVGYFGRSGKRGPDDAKARSSGARLIDIAAQLGAALFIVALFASLGGLAVGMVKEAFGGDDLTQTDEQGVRVLTLLLLCGALLTLVFSHYVARNRYSMSALYGNRLVRAFLGSARGESLRIPHAFTQFDPADDLQLGQLSMKPPLIHIVNAALNVSAPALTELASQQRKAAQFLFRAEKCGWPERQGVQESAECPSGEYGSKVGLSLGRAIAISGAAASPNMGYHTSPLMAFVLCFFNVRLGAWLPNPRYTPKHPGPMLPPEEKKYQDAVELMREEEPENPLVLTGAELLGRTTTSDDFVYISDGGHFDNLGLYEAVRRKCVRILVVDASCDPSYQYEDLERAIRFIRADLGVSIEFSKALPGLGVDGKVQCHISEGVVNYGAQGNGKRLVGKILYVKPGLTGDEPVDVLAFAVNCRQRGIPFPHHSTSNQFFEETHFESYRTLGFHSISGPQLRGEPLPMWDFNEFKPLYVEKEGSRPAAEALAKLLGPAVPPTPGRGSSGPALAALLAAVLILGGLAWVAISKFRHAPDVVYTGGSDFEAVSTNVVNIHFVKQPTRFVVGLFKVASNCSAMDGFACLSGTQLQDTDLASLARLNVAFNRCTGAPAMSSPRGPVVDVHGLADSRGFPDSARNGALGPYPNVRLADYRACVVAQKMNGYPGGVTYKAISWHGDVPLVQGCKLVDPKMADYTVEDAMALDSARRADRDANGPVEEPAAAANRGVVFQLEQPDQYDCTVDAFQAALRKGLETQ